MSSANASIYSKSTLEEMKVMSEEFVIEMRVEKYKGRGFINTVNKFYSYHRVDFLTLTGLTSADASYFENVNVFPTA